ncbi:SPW repeat protein [Kibdelosporangium phytohabitans]|uniref:SPW repeat-containing integral membrane domain-containing protein n=1 Tax=Kibdelosporangium phytohabitans TaxID=860235 RepID=A0A0N9IJ57_9PSEU|nr:SPW repeat protein [Kibdelosporangium phytohabitans]ALG15573.1 hypothetical protein AOZ06_46120 [Kibdelosporangium phytohabitans]MBE1465037.1 uncharacterized membrane protein HdeD (DUF308 family) [Kibdelosporangium phytohabitans]
MSGTSTPVRAWTRWQDWAEVVLGVVAVLSPLWLDTTNIVMWTMIVLGALIALDGLFSLAMPGVVYGEYVQVVLGVLLFISPWVMGFTDMTGAMWSSFVIGALTLVVGLAALPAATTAHRGMAGQH